MINLSKTNVDQYVNPAEPAPFAIQGDGQKCWKITSVKDDCVYKIWAHSYTDALQRLSQIESF